MSDQSVAEIARELAAALLKRAKTRHPEDQKAVLALQTVLVAEIETERIEGMRQAREDIAAEKLKRDDGLRSGYPAGMDPIDLHD
jgi:hypothetical protein